MTKKFTIIQLFSLLDGRLATTIDDVYLTLNHITDDNLMTHHLPVAFNYVKLKNPKWFDELKKLIADAETLCPIKERNHQQFEWLIEYFKTHNTEHEIPQLKDEFDTSDFGKYMIDNSLLNKLGSKSKA